MATNYPRTFSADQHLAIMREVREAQQENAAHIRALADAVSASTKAQAEAADRMAAFVAAVEVLKDKAERHDKDIDALKAYNQAQLDRAAAQRFTLGNNMAGWLIMGVVFVLGWIATGVIQFHFPTK